MSPPWQKTPECPRFSPFLFKVLARQQVDPDSFSNATFSPLAGITAVNPIVLQAPAPPDANETGWKDTVRVNPGEMVAIAAQFSGFTGR